VATIIAVRRRGRAPFTPDDLMDLTDLAARTGIAIDTLRRNAREHSNSVALQQALLTAPPQTPGLQIVTRYLPATNGNEIGGDWYDAYLQSDGTPMLAIGDVVGHDIHAAASMGHLRSLIRTVGYTTGGAPADILSRSDAAARGLGVDVLATAVIACVETRGAEGANLRWSNAGHPPPVLITQQGPRLLDAAPDRPLGLGPTLARTRHDHVASLERGDTVLLYTDGLIERVDEDLDAVIARLLTTLDQARSADLEELCDHVLAERGHGTTDDIALLAVRLG
jgi:serine phosphatase RsbU (regulator of sigma subunit)